MAAAHASNSSRRSLTLSTKRKKEKKRITLSVTRYFRHEQNDRANRLISRPTREIPSARLRVGDERSFGGSGGTKARRLKSVDIQRVACRVHRNDETTSRNKRDPLVECSRFPPVRLLYFPVERVEKEERLLLFLHSTAKDHYAARVGRLLVNNVCQSRITVRFV